MHLSLVLSRYVFGHKGFLPFCGLALRTRQKAHQFNWLLSIDMSQVHTPINQK